MSLTGNFVLAPQALAWGLVNAVVPHDELLDTARSLALDIAGSDQRAVRALLDEYEQTSATTVAEGLRIEAGIAAEWNAAAGADVERRRQSIIDRGRTQL